MQSKWTCPKNQNQPITFVCIGNSWHFQPLCNLCVPDHTQNHPKNIKIQMQSLTKVLDHSSSIKSNVIQIYTQKLKKCQQLSQIKSQQHAYIIQLKQKQVFLIQKINIYFNNIISTLSQKRTQSIKLQQQNLKKISKTLQQNISFLKAQKETTSIVDFCRQIKKFYFKESLQMYIQQVQEIMNQYKEKVINCQPIIWIKEKDMENKIDKCMDDMYKLDIEKKQKVEKVDIKKQVKKKQVQKKKCPNCKEQMEYLTQWKKHLICRSCGGKQRNYVKKT